MAVQRGWIIGLLTHHPVAKLFSVIAATLLMMFIDRELTRTIYDQDVTVVGEASASDRGVLRIRTDDEYIVLVDEKAGRQKVKLIVRGQNKQLEMLQSLEPFQAHLPSERLATLFPKTASVKGLVPPSVTVETADLRLLPFDRDQIQLGPLQVQVDQRHQKKVLLTHSGTDTSFEVVFLPREVEIVGPRRFLEDVTTIDLDVKEAWAERDLRLAIQNWFVKKRPEWAAYFSVVEGQTLSVTVTRRPEESKDIALTVRIYPLFRFGSPYEAKIAEDGQDLAQLTFRGPKSLVDALQENPAERERLQRELTVCARVEGILDETKLKEARDANLDDREAWWRSENAELMYDTAVLDKHGLTAPARVTIKVRLKK